MTTWKPVPSVLTTFLRPRPSSNSHAYSSYRRSLHRHVKAGKIPLPTPFVPDVSTFLTLIGRELSKHSSKFGSWNDLFSLSSTQLKELGIEPPRTRRYLLRWREKFSNGDFGIGGDLKHVQDGIGELRVVELPSLRSHEENSEAPSISQNPGMTKLVVNVPNGSSSYSLEGGQQTRDLRKPKGVRLKDGHIITGEYVQPMKGTKGSVATLKVTDGMWEHRRGRKVYGGERRRNETMHKMRAEERKKA